MKLLIRVAAAATLALVAAGCGQSGTTAALDAGGTQVQLRSIQTRAFDTTDKTRTLRTVMATMQDLGFVLDQADGTLGSLSGTKPGYRDVWSGTSHVLRMTVTVRPRGQSEMLVRANVQYGLQTVADARPYRQFFTSLEKAMFLRAHNVD